MRGGRWIVRCAACALVLVSANGCASLDAYRRVEAQNRALNADKVALQQELTDLRSGNDVLRSQVTAMQRELDAKGELVTNLRGENDVLDDMRRLAMGQLEDLGNRQRLGDITIEGSPLPAPLDNALREFATNHPNLIVYDAQRGLIKWNADLLFDLGSDAVKQGSLDALKEFNDIIKSQAAADYEVVVIGHTDNRPISRPQTKEKHPTNWHLSAHRAISVAASLRQFGYPPTKIGVMGFGEFRPVADNASEAGQSQNRRVDIFLIRSGAFAQAKPADLKPAAKQGT